MIIKSIEDIKALSNDDFYFSIFNKETGIAKFSMSMFCIIIELCFFNFYYKSKDEEDIKNYISNNSLV